ncbi:hypothetical protein [Tetragenococcus muriaticus]|uniref:Uncharacterized protein n=1 Tax=Tetragenococcus muriaticus 3MR10-3 TaxID=1302648 RepID=A0A091C506_9ENTE|nr:hypothetical protein [Tetragenococcus muriaticus]KFN91979.1 hypothetical protein TMU3MR103_0701 [Tetragenococcus muriaticus 3MR10-3]
MFYLVRELLGLLIIIVGVGITTSPFWGLALWLYKRHQKKMNKINGHLD